MKKLALFLLVVVTFSQGAEVIMVGKSGKFMAVSKPDAGEWWIGAKVCAVRNRREIACGVVRKVDGRGAVVELQLRREMPVRGDFVRAGWRGIASAPSVLSRRVEIDHGPGMNVTLGTIISSAYVIPTLHFDFRLVSFLTLGVQAAYFSISSTTAMATTGKAVPVFATLGIYPSESYDGFFAQVAVGEYLYSISGQGTSESPATFGGYGTLGYRKAFHKSFNAAVGLGAQYFPPPTSNLITLAFSSVQPIITLDIGYRF